MLYLVRHAKAGTRKEWAGDDTSRPLTPAGWRQAEALARKLAKRGTTTLMSSPYVRCVQTLEPLAQLMGQPVMTDHRLAEGNDFRAVFELFAALTDGAVLCSHGDVIPEVIGALERRGCAFTSSPDWRKASVWVLRREDAGDIVSAKAWAPPDA